MKQTIKYLLFFVSDALKYEFKWHQRSGDLEKLKHLSSDAVLVRPLPESYISTQICDLCNDFKLYCRFYLKQIRIACTYISIVIEILLFL